MENTELNKDILDAVAKCDAYMAMPNEPGEKIDGFINASKWNANQNNYTDTRFINHEATLVFDNEYCASIDWKNKNGSSRYYINFLIDKRRGNLIITGDTGENIAKFCQHVDIAKMRHLVEGDDSYFTKKLTDRESKDESCVHLWTTGFCMACDQLGIEAKR